MSGAEGDNLEDIFSGISDLLAGRPVAPSSVSEPLVGADIAVEVKEINESKKALMIRIAQQLLTQVNGSTKAEDFAKDIVGFFESFKYYTVNDLRLKGMEDDAVAVQNSTLTDLAEGAGSCIDEYEHSVFDADDEGKIALDVVIRDMKTIISAVEIAQKQTE